MWDVESPLDFSYKPFTNMSEFTNRGNENNHKMNADVSLLVNGERSRLLAEIPSIVPLNVGGIRYMTRRSTLRRYPESMLAAMFSGRHEVDVDNDGCYFLDVNGATFEHILEFLRDGTLPPKSSVQSVYHLAKYFALSDLVVRLEGTPKIAKEIVQKAHRDLFPNYEDIKLAIVQMAIQKASKTQRGCVNILVCKSSSGHDCHPDGHPCRKPEHPADIRVGPWDSDLNSDYFMHTLYTDLLKDGFELAKKNHITCDFTSKEHFPVRIYPLVFDFE